MGRAIPMHPSAKKIDPATTKKPFLSLLGSERFGSKRSSDSLDQP